MTTAASSPLKPCRKCGKQPEYDAGAKEYKCPNYFNHAIEDAEESARLAMKRAADRWNSGITQP